MAWAAAGVTWAEEAESAPAGAVAGAVGTGTDTADPEPGEGTASEPVEEFVFEPAEGVASEPAEGVVFVAGAEAVAGFDEAEAVLSGFPPEAEPLLASPPF